MTDTEKYLNRYYYEKQGDLTQAQRNILDTLDKAQLDGRERELVRLRYFENRPAWQVADAMRYSESMCRIIRAGLLKKIEKVLNRT